MAASKISYYVQSFNSYLQMYYGLVPLCLQETINLLAIFDHSLS